VTPSQRKRRLAKLARLTHKLALQFQEVADSDDPSIDKLAALNGCAAEVADLREQLADAKGFLAADAKGSLTHEQIAARLGVSKPYVQQMVYRGRTS